MLGSRRRARLSARAQTRTRAGFAERYGDQADAQIAVRTEAAHRGIPETLAAIKRTAEQR